MFLVQINAINGVLKELTHVGCDRAKAETAYFDACKTNLSDWDEYTPHDRDTVLTEGYCLYGNGCIMFIDTDGFTSDNAIRSELAKEPPSTVEKIKRWVHAGDIGEHQETISDVLSAAGQCLEAAQSYDICGEILFQAEDGEWYVGTVEFGISKAHENYLEDALAEAGDRNDTGAKNE